VKDQILQTLRDLRAYAKNNGVEAAIFYHEEESFLMRFANSAVSLNTNEHLVRIEITAYEGRKRASYEMITSLGAIDTMKQGIDTAAEMVKHVQPLDYNPSVKVYTENYIDESCYDDSLAHISNEERLAFISQAVEGLENDDIKLSGIFSCGANTTAQINTRSENLQYFKSSDAQISIVLSHSALNWEVISEQSAQKKSDLNPLQLRSELSFLVELYVNNTPQQLSFEKYDVIFGSAAISELVSFMNWIGSSGGAMKRGFSFIKEDDTGKKIFSDKFSLTDDPTRRESLPFLRDMTGILRKPFSIVENGVFRSFTWDQDDADEFGVEATGHTVKHNSLVVHGGDKSVNTLRELMSMPRDRDTLYIPYLHYMNIVNPSKGLITASSRFGALLLKSDGSVTVPYNVRITQSMSDIFGDKLAWLSDTQCAYNTSMSYGARNPTAVITPKFILVNDLEVSHTNSPVDK
jgi:predicted Zn-dependent protease